MILAIALLMLLAGYLINCPLPPRAKWILFAVSLVFALALAVNACLKITRTRVFDEEM